MMSKENNFILQANSIDTGYGKKQILFDASINIKKEEIVGIIGPNGSGKSTLLKAIFGLLPCWKGDIVYINNSNKNSTTHNVQNGLCFLPQGSQVFTELTILDNLEIGGYFIKNRKVFQEKLNQVFHIFPFLKQRQKEDAGNLSGGEQQQLSFARVLMASPQLILMDEPSLGLSPKLVIQSMNKIVELNEKLGITILIVEQKVRELMKICHRAYALRMGKIVFEGKPNDFTNDVMKNIFLG